MQPGRRGRPAPAREARRQATRRRPLGESAFYQPFVVETAMVLRCGYPPVLDASRDWDVMRGGDSRTAYSQGRGGTTGRDATGRKNRRSPPLPLAASPYP